LRVLDGVFVFKSFQKNSDPRGCEGRRNALFVRADRFVLHASSTLIQSEQDLVALPIFKGIVLQSIEPQKSNCSFVSQKRIQEKLNSQKRQLPPAKICSTLIGPSHMKK
jgi:hypothetical protein